MKHYISLLLFFATLTVCANENIKFRHITMSDGLSDNQITHITRDSQGFMWFSTSNGLNRYDGYTIKVFSRNPELPNGMNSSYVESLQEDANGYLWVKHWTGNYECFDPYKEIFIDAKDLFEKFGVTDKISLLYIDRYKNLWMHSDTSGTFHYDFSTKKLTLVPQNSAKANNAEFKVTYISEDRDGILRMYSNGFFDHVDRVEHNIDYENSYLSSNADLADSEYRIFADKDGDYWIWNKKGVWTYYSHEKHWEFNNSDKDSNYPLSGNHVYSIINDRYGRIWIGIDHGGINIIDKKLKTIRHIVHAEVDESSLIHNSVNHLYADSDGTIWAGTFRLGISYYNENLFKFYTDHFTEFHNIKTFTPDVTYFIEDKDKNIYLGVPSGIIKMNSTLQQKNLISIPTPHISFPDDVILGIEYTPDGKLWLGTYQSGLISYDNNTFTSHTLDTGNKDSKANRTIWSLARDKSGYLWIGTWGAGLWGIDPVSGKCRQYNDANGTFNNQEITSICVSKDGNLYMATTYGMLIYYPATGIFEKLLGNRKYEVALTDANLSHITEDSRGLLWISTREGINVYDRKNDNLTILPGTLRNSIIHGTVEDNDKNMWATTSTGIYHIIVSGRESSYNFDIQRYDDLSVSENQQFNPRAIGKTSDGRIAIGGTKGVSFIDPTNITYNPKTPDVIFSNLTLFNKTVKIDSLYQGNRILTSALNHADEIKLNYSQNVFSVIFSAMDYTSPGKNGYMYKLEGFDPEWTFTTDNKLSYTNLAPGSYTLKVKAINEDGVTEGNTAQLKITIAPPFYKSWIAYIIYVLLIIGILLLIRAYMRHNEAQKYTLMQIQQEAKQKHEIDNMKLRFFTNISHDLRTPLTLILTPLEYVTEHIDNPELKDKLVIAHKNALRLLDMVNQLLDFRKSDMTGHTIVPNQGDIVDTIRTLCDNFAAYSEQRNINLTFFSPVKKLYMMYDEDKINKIIMNLLSNAFKFTPEGGRVDVSLDILPEQDGQPEMLEIKVADNGCGISDEHKELIFERFYQVPRTDSKIARGSGVGLNLVKEFVTLHKGTITVYDNIGKGSVFVIKIPVERVAADKEAAPDTVPTTTDATLSATAIDNEPDKNSAKRPSILLVDDNDDFRTFMKDCLKSDYTIHEAADGEEAWNMVPELQPDIIVSDVMMPKMNGNELCSLVKNDIRTSHILVILLTARAAKEHEQKGLEVGADDYITKPFNLNILTLRIKNLLQHRLDTHSRVMEVSPSKIDITSLDEKLITKAIRYVEENLNRSDLSVEELSSELGMSRVHLYKKMLSITGKTPIEFIRILRLKRAAQLLRESQLSIAEVTYQTGFNNLNLFRKYFKAEFGMLPSEYQAKHSGHYQNTSI